MPSSFVIAAVGSGGKTTALKKLACQAALRRDSGSVLLTASTHMYPVLPPESRVYLRDPDKETLCRELAKPGIVCAGRTARDEKLSALEPELFSAALQTASVILCEADGSRRLPLKLHSEWEPVLPARTDVCLITAGLSALGKEAGSCIHRYQLNPAWKARPDTRIGGEELALCVLDAVSSVMLPAEQDGSLCSLENRSFSGRLPKDRIRILLNQADCLLCPESGASSLAALQKEASIAVKILNERGLCCRMGSLLEDSSFLWDWVCAPGRLEKADLSAGRKSQ